MQLLELIMLLMTLILITCISFFGRNRKIQRLLIYMNLALLILHGLFEVIRWQMAFVYLIFFVLVLLYFKKTTSLLFIRISGFLIGLVILGISVFYSFTMPILMLEAPQGEYVVGNRIFTLEDANRRERNSIDPNDKRVLLLEIWYPGKPDTGIKAKSLWSGLYSGKGDIISFFTNYLQKVDTHSFPKLEPAQGRYPLILFNHGLQMFTAQNTLLMEHLASNGYIVVSIGHPYESIRVDLGQNKIILPEFISSFEKFKEGMKWVESASAPIIRAQEEIASLKDPEERSKIVLEAIEKAEVINDIVVSWSYDTKFVLSWLIENSSSNLSGVIPDINTEAIGMMGMSIGGATAGELCKVDSRIVAGINIDGIQYGKTQRDSLHVPFMMFTSDESDGMNNFMYLRSRNDYYEYHLKNTRHSDLTDMVIVWPILKFYGQSGKIAGNRVIEIMNTSILNFWDKYLKNDQEINLLKSHFPELDIKSNVRN